MGMFPLSPAPPLAPPSFSQLAELLFRTQLTGLAKSAAHQALLYSQEDLVLQVRLAAQRVRPKSNA